VPNNVAGNADPREAWKLWLATTMDVWRGVIKMEETRFGVITGWVNDDGTCFRREQTPVSLCRLTFPCCFNEWYEAMSKPWSKTG